MRGFFDQAPPKSKTKGMALEQGKYSIVYADPPWNYNDKQGHRPLPYPSMSTEDIARLDVKGITNQDAFLFIWVTFPILPEIFKIMESWGFEYKTVAWGWVKTNPGNPLSLFTGMGHYTRANLELLLLGKRGRIRVLNRAMVNVVHAPVEAHSKKPDFFRQQILGLCGDLPRIELFARQKAPGWDCWGNEVESDIIL